MAKEKLSLRRKAVKRARVGKNSVKSRRKMVPDVASVPRKGTELAERHLALHPESKVLFMSGYMDDFMLRRNGISQDAPILQKPFSMDLLIRRLRELLDGEHDSG